MRFVELRPSPERPAYRLHPRITVLRGLDPAARVAVVGLAHDVALGHVPEWDGLVDVDGDCLSLAEAVDQLGETGHAALIVDAASLPSVSAQDRGPFAAPEESLAEAEAKLQDLDDRITGLAEELAAGGKVRMEMTAQLVSAKAQVDAGASAALDRADGALGRAARLASRPDPWTGMGDVPGRIVELRELLSSLEESLAALPSGDRSALAAATATARAAISVGPVPCPEATALAQVWISLHQRVAGLESRIEAAGGGTEAVAARLDVARVAARAAEDAAIPRVIRPDEAATLERLHEVMIDAEQKTGRAVRRGANRAAYEKAEAELQAVLAPLGYPTWAAFRMGNGLASVPAEAMKEYQRAQIVLEAAEIELAQLTMRLQQDTELQDVLAAIDQALEQAKKLLGENSLDGADRRDPAVVTTALQAVTIDAATIGVRRDAAVQHLRRALGESGAIGIDPLTSDAAIVALGDTWLAVLDAADEAAVRILRDQERAEEELAALVALGDGTRVDRLDAERDTVRRAEEKVAETRAALCKVVRAQMQLYVLAATELGLAEEHDDRLVQRESAQVLADLAAGRVDGSANRDAVIALAERVPRGIGGPVPVVVVMGDAPAERLDRLVAFPDDVQILVIGECAGVDEWLDRVGPDTAALMDAGSLV